MSSPQNLDYERAEEILAEAECETSAAELQAIICGMVSAGLKANSAAWRVTMAELADQGNPWSLDGEWLLAELFSWTQQQMSQQDALAPMLLPDETYPVFDKMEAIADWADGFLLGFGVQAGNITIESPEVNEALSDLSEIAQLALQAEDNEETQSALFTIIEHIKVVVQVIYWEQVVKHGQTLTGSADDSPGNDTGRLH